MASQGFLLRGIEHDAERVLDIVRSKRWRHDIIRRTNQHSEEEKKESDSKPDQYRIQQLQQIYRRHFGDAVNDYGSDGRSRLENLIAAAVTAQGKASHVLPARIGAAVLSSNGKIYAACNIHSGDDTQMIVCAERMALLKAVGDDSECVVEGMVLSSDQHGACPYPCGACRQFMSTFGNFNVYCLRDDLTYEQTSVSELFPKAQVPVVTRGSIQNTRVPSDSQSKDSTLVENWSVRQVCDWICGPDMGLHEYESNFMGNRIDGKTLLLLEESDLQLLVGIHHAVHRKKILQSIDRLKDSELLQHGIDYGQLHDYISILQKDQITMIAQLKETFDRLDTDKDGKLEYHEVRKALSEYTAIRATPEAVERWIAARDTTGDGKVTFSEFALAINQHEHVKSRSEGKHFYFKIDLVELRRTFDAFDTSGNDSIEFKELVEGFNNLGIKDCDEKAEEWFSKADVDDSATISYAEFVLRYAQMTGVNLTPLDEVYHSFESSTSLQPISILPEAFGKLNAIFDQEKVNQWSRDRFENGLKRISFADFVLACALFCKDSDSECDDKEPDERFHRNRIIQLQKSGHVRLRERKRPPRRRVSDGSIDQNSDEEESSGDEYKRIIRHPKELLWIKTTFKRFCSDGRDPQMLNAIEAAQALTEVGIPAKRNQILRYLKQRGIVARKRKMDVFGFLTAVADFKSEMQERNFHTVSYRARQHARHMQKMMDLEKKRFGKHKTKEKYDEYLRRRCQTKQRLGSDEESSADEKRQRRSKRKESPRSRRSSSPKRGRRRESQRSSSTSSDDRRRHRRSVSSDKNQEFQRKDRVIVRRSGVGTVLKIDDDGFMTIRLDSGKTKRQVNPKIVSHAPERSSDSDSDRTPVRRRGR